jgi:hypothetical protein
MNIPTNVLPPEILTSRPVQVLAAFVAVNSLIFVVLAVMSLLPKSHPSTWFTSRDRRSETRSINPNARR